jgi:hypothetical protein
MDTNSAWAKTRKRMEDFAREVGTLLVAFAPLDAALGTDQPGKWRLMLLFAGTGLLCVAGALIAEHRRERDAQ